MSHFWRAIGITCLFMAVAFALAGFTIPCLSSFAEAFFAALFSVFFAFGIAILVIDGRLMTRLGRRNEVIKRSSRSIIYDVAYAISQDTLALGRWLGSVLPEQVDVDEEINNNQDMSWESSVNPVLRKVFQLAKQVRAADIESLNPIPSDHYKRTVFNRRDFVRDVRKRLESNLDVHERLLESSEKLEELEQVITPCLFPVNIREEENRFRCLGQLGIACVEFHESLNRIYRRL